MRRVQSRVRRRPVSSIGVCEERPGQGLRAVHPGMPLGGVHGAVVHADAGYGVPQLQSVSRRTIRELGLHRDPRHAMHDVRVLRRRFFRQWRVRGWTEYNLLGVSNVQQRIRPQLRRLVWALQIGAGLHTEHVQGSGVHTDVEHCLQMVQRLHVLFHVLPTGVRRRIGHGVRGMHLLFPGHLHDGHLHVHPEYPMQRVYRVPGRHLRDGALHQLSAWE